MNSVAGIRKDNRLNTTESASLCGHVTHDFHLSPASAILQSRIRIFVFVGGKMARGRKEIVL
ncbi:hypothetical protein CHS0354_001793 [Potamilus streckersoni]|uniref:Uncharacterized protein n=1 Tax=Potamilus streckersoni TaxID=2493646 RepID=A0AAE0S4K1_9BIVA|nr:hypothetical protein CHS0354_001793 [Potamilus streckersoni]